MSEVRGKGRRLVSLMLAFAMVLSLFGSISFSGAAQAAEPELSPYADDQTTTTVSDKPTLFIDFLGDNQIGLPYASVPSTKDESQLQSNGPWLKYDNDDQVDTIFWVGVGIDKMSLFELAKEGRGLTGLELGFYYNPNYVEPYTGASGETYQSVLEGANLAANIGTESINQWDSNFYQITQAIPNRDLTSDPDTREYDLVAPNLPYATTDTWKMLYISLEKYQDLENIDTNRFHDVTADDAETKYIMMLPFKLKAIDHTAPIEGVDGSGPQLCFRLARDASTFSMGGGATGAGVFDDKNDPSSFGAWERSTRTPNHNLKEMFSFEGDLNIFTGKNEIPRSFNAHLLIWNPSAPDGNTATLSDGVRVIGGVSGVVAISNATMDKVQSGITMTVEVSKGTVNPTTATVSLTPTSGSTPVPALTLVSSTSDLDVYTFTMPADDITVEILYDTEYDGPTSYNAKLILENTDGKSANTATLTHEWTDNTQTPPADESESTSPTKDLLKGISYKDKMSVHVQTHPDYIATVKVTRRSDPSIVIGTTALGLDRELGTDRWIGDCTFEMPAGNVDVTVTYIKRNTYYAELVVNYDDAGDTRNKAVLSYLDYTGDPAGIPNDDKRKSVTVDGPGSTKSLPNVPTGRMLTLEVTVLKNYEIDEAWFYNADDHTALPIDLKGIILGGSSSTDDIAGTTTYTVQVPNNIGGMDGMPEHNVQVMVRFRESKAYTAHLRLDKAGNMAANWATLSGMDGNKNTGNNNSVTRIGTDGTAYADTTIFSGNDVSMNWGTASGYEIARITVFTDPNEWNPKYQFSTEADLAALKADGFTMPTRDIWVVVEYKSNNYTATMVPVDTSGNPTPAGYNLTGTGWDTGAAYPIYPTVTNAEGSPVKGGIQVLPGWYIASYKIVGETTGLEYSFQSFSGNGYNNGSGGPVTMELFQPGENVRVYLEMVYGQPPEEPVQSLTLRVNDPDNTTSDNNWARIIKVDDDTLSPTRPVVRKPAGIPGQVTHDTYQPLTAGQKTTIQVEHTPSYRVASVDVTPADSFGTVVPDWADDGKSFTITQPAGSITVTVNFEKIDPAHPREQTATLHIAGGTTDNTATLTNEGPDPDTSTNVDGGQVAFMTGDPFTLDVTTGDGYTALATVVQGGSTRTIGLTPGVSTDLSGDFTGLPGDAEVYVSFMKVADVHEGDHTLILKAVGPAGEAVGLAGTAQLTFGTPVTTVGPAQSNDAGIPTMVTGGETVTVTGDPNTGYSIDYITYIANGLTTPVPVTNGEEFVMPGEDLTVEVHFKKGEEKRNHTANIVLRLDGSTGPVDTSVVGDAGFGASPTDPAVYACSVPTGTPLDVWALAKNGYYIRKVEVTPAELGVTGSFPGGFGLKNIDFNMPDADVTVNVYFAKGWPDDAQFDATLVVKDIAHMSDNHAQFTDPVGAGPVSDGMSDTVSAKHGDTLEIQVDRATGYTCDVLVKDDAGTVLAENVDWYWKDGKLKVNMPMMGVTVTLTYRIEEPDKDVHKATLHITGTPLTGDTAEISFGTLPPVSTHGDSLSPLHQGDVVTIKVSGPDAPPSVLVTNSSTGLTNTTLTSLTDDGTGTYTATFTMQDDNAEVYVSFSSVEPPDPNLDYEKITLVATGPIGVGKTGEATLTNPNPTPSIDVTAEADPVGMGAIYALPGEDLDLKADPATGYEVEKIELIDVDGNVTLLTGPVTDWTGTVTMPGVPNNVPNDGPAKVVVTFKEAPLPHSLKATLVVNNAGDTRNTAALSSLAGVTSAAGDLITGLSLGDLVNVDITRVSPLHVPKITVQPVGKVTNDVDKDRYFTMPDVDVVVYVEFVEDTTQRYDISMKVETATGSAVDNANTASMSSPLTSTQGPIYTGQDPVHVLARAGVDTVTITVNRQPGYWVEVTTVAAGGTTVKNATLKDPDADTFTFTIPASNVEATVIFHEESVEPIPEYDVVLHLLDKDYKPIDLSAWTAYLSEFQENFVSWGTQKTDLTADPPVTTIKAPYGKPVHVAAKATTIQDYSFVKEAYAVYGNLPAIMLPAIDGTLSETYAPAGSGTRIERTFDFTMQKGQVDVYIVLDNAADAPDKPEYTAALTVTGPLKDNSGVAEPVGAAGKATLTRGGGDHRAVTVNSNQLFYDPGTPEDHTLTAAVGEKLTLTVTVNPGYKIDTVTVTPLGLALTHDSVSTDDATGVSTYTYTMPAADLAINVDLVRDGDVVFHKVTLDLTDATGSANSTNVSYATYSATKDGDNFPVPKDQTVTMDLTAAPDAYIKHAYAVTKSGTVLPLTITTPTGLTTLQNYGSDNSTDPAHGVATFVMPDEDVTVFVEYEKDENPPTGDFTAVITVFDPDNTGDSSATMTRSANTDSVSAVSDGVTSDPLSVNAGEKITVQLTVAEGYKVKSVELTGGGQPAVTLTDKGGYVYEFNMPDPGYDVGVIVTLEEAEADTFTATLVTVDHTGAIGNNTNMRIQGAPGSGVNWSGTITNLVGNETVVTTVTLAEGVRVAAVLATNKNGTKVLPVSATVNRYDYTMSADAGDVTITVILDDNAPSIEPMHVVNVVKRDNADRTGNDALNLKNTTNPALPGGPLWVGAYEDDLVTLDVTTASGVYAKATAVDRNGKQVTVHQQGLTGDVKVWLDTPDKDVTIIIDWSDTAPDLQKYDLTLEMKGDADIQGSGTRVDLTGGVDALYVPNDKSGSGVMSNTDSTKATEGDNLTLTESPNGYFVKRITLIVGGAEIDLPVTTTSIVMPSANAKVVVTFEKGEQTARPYDPAQDPNTKGYTRGYLIANNPGYNSLEITVPNLFDAAKDDTGLTPNPGMETVPAGTLFTLYYKDGGEVIKLVPGVDYDVTSGPTAYTHDGFTGQRFTIRSLKGESPLTHVAVNGGLLYITATDPVTPKKESQLVEVEVPEDPSRGSHTATLRIVDSSGVTGNVAEMNAVVGSTGVSTTVNTDGAVIGGLLGSERIRTMAKAASGARISAVTATVVDSNGSPVGGTVLLTMLPTSPLSDGSQRYPFDMTGENVVITVYFESDGTNLDEPTRYIASVEKRGATAVPGNDATITNEFRTDLGKGSIWAEGHEDNVMRVNVTTAPGYYANVVAVRKDTGAEVAAAVLGLGNGTPFDVLFTMPAADVQVTVTYYDHPPEKTAYTLTLKVTDPTGEAKNTAKVTWTGTGSPLEANGSSPTDTTASGEEVPVGTTLNVEALAALITTTAGDPPETTTTDYYVKEAKITWTTPGGGLGSRNIPLTPSALTERLMVGNTTMPVGDAIIEVTFAKGPRSPRPFDPNHSELYTGGGYFLPEGHQTGWISATTLPDTLDGRGQIQITVPALYAEEKDDPADRLLDAVENYNFYWLDDKGYHKLEWGTDIILSDDALLEDNATYAGKDLDAYRFTVTAAHRNSEIDYYIHHGGTIYITNAADPESDYTQVWITRYFKATLRYEPNGVIATMEENSKDKKSVNTNGGVLSDLPDKTVLTVKGITPDPGYTFLGVVASTASGSENVLENPANSGEYPYTLDGEDVELRVVFKADDDPLRDKGPYIVTVQKENDDGLSGNTATVEDLDVEIPPEQRGNIWTAAYEDNVVRVNVTTETGYYALITAVEKSTGATVPVVQFKDYGQFYMPKDHVDVTVTYVNELPEYGLYLTVDGPLGEGVSDGYQTTLIPKGHPGVVVTGNVDKTPAAVAGDKIPAGNKLELITRPNGPYTVKSAVMVVNGVSIAIPLTDGISLPLAEMPFADAEVIVTYINEDQTARPYDPNHSEQYNTPAYAHGSKDDLSRTSQEGWILAETLNSHQFSITVPILHKKATNGLTDLIFSADDVPTYKLYWKDKMGNFQLLEEGVDITITDRETVANTFTMGANSYDGCKFTVTVKEDDPKSLWTLWGGYTLNDYLTKGGGSIYISATGGSSSVNGNESEKTEVVVLPADGDLIATFEVVDDATDDTSTRTHTLDDGKGHTVDTSGQQITQLRGGETMTTTVDVSALNPDAEVQSVTVTTASGGTTFVTGGAVPSTTPNTYADTMPKENATYTLILRDRDSDRYTAAVQIVDPFGLAGNNADIVNTADSTASHGSIWVTGKGDEDASGKPTGEKMAVTFNTDTVDSNGPFFVDVKAYRTDTGAEIPSIQLGVTGTGNAYFDMPKSNVQVIVTFSTKAPGDVPLLLTLSGHALQEKNVATVSWTDGMGAAKNLSAKGTEAPDTNDYTVPNDGTNELLTTLVTPGTKLTVAPTAADGYVVDSIKIKDELSGYEFTLTIEDGKADTLMPMILQSPTKAARVTVTWKPGRQTPRPFDPEHDPDYSTATTKYAHNTDDDLSTTHRDGWILATNLGGGKVKVLVPTLAKDVTPAAPTDPNQELYDVKDTHTFKLYSYAAGVYTLLEEGKDYTLSGRTTVNNAYTTYTGTEFTLSEKEGGKLEGLLDKGLSLYITATDSDDSDPDLPWFESERTELVIPSNGLVPYDPDRVGDTTGTYENHWIRAENWGDYLTVTVPTLNKKKDGPVTDVEDVDGDHHAFRFYLQEDGTNRSNAVADVTDLIRLTNYDKFFDETWTLPTPPAYAHQEEYKWDNYYTVDPGTASEKKIQGARFVWEVLTNKEIEALFEDSNSAEATAAKANAAILREIMDNYGTMKDATSADEEDKRRLYITVADDTDSANVREGERVDFEVPRYYSLTGTLQSWAPTHMAKLSIHLLEGAAYQKTPFLSIEVGLDPAEYPSAVHAGHWEQSFTFKSSELVDKTFRLKVKKTSHITYIHDDLDMDATATNAQYDEDTLTFTLAGTISLFCGDLDPIFPGPDGKIGDLDRNLLAGFLYGEFDWSQDGEDGPDWNVSTHNPDSYAYAADLDGDGLITDLDMAILMSDYNFGRWQEDYDDPKGLDYEATGFAIPFSEFAAFFTEMTELTPADTYKIDPDTVIIEVEKPTAPTDPNDPTDPTDPADPVDPVDPTEPTDPTDPVDPVDPTDPADPTDSVDPTDPVTPEVPPEEPPTEEEEPPDEDGEEELPSEGGELPGAGEEPPETSPGPAEPIVPEGIEEDGGPEAVAETFT